MGQLLYLEDQGYQRNHTERFLCEDGYDVFSCGRIDEAMDYLSKNYKQIDCIITDLNMNDEWLGGYRSESNGCLFSGWVWLNRYVLTDENTKNIPCIIYSGFIRDLEDHLRMLGEQSLRKRKILCVRKGGNNRGCYKELKNTLMSIGVSGKVNN